MAQHANRRLAAIVSADVVGAVCCVAEVQTAMALRNADLPQNRRLEFRVGVNFGDIIIDGDDIFGDGVNVAARLQESAKPGQSLKNISRPVRV